MSRYASINIAAMTKLVSAIDSASQPLLFAPSSYSQVMSPVDVDSTPADKLSQVSFWIADAEPGLKRRLALAQAMEAQGKSFQGVITIDETKLSTVDPLTAQNNGATAAKQLRDAHGKVSDKLRNEIAKNATDPYFAAGFGKSLTPDQLAQITQDASNALRTGEDGGGPGSQAYKNYRALLVGMGETMGTATRNTNDLALPPDTAQQWSNVITAEPGPTSYTPNQAAALSVLLRHGDYDSKFLNTVSSNVYNYERSKGGDPVWGPRANTTSPIFNPDATSTDNDLATDAMANCLAGLGHNPDAAQQFFDVGNPNASTTKVKIDGKEIPFNSRLEYLITERTWSPDKGSDNGTGLGGALQAATTFYRNNGPSGAISATIASETLALIGNKTGSDKSGGLPVLHIGANSGWHMWSGMRQNVANIVASYAPDLLRLGSSGSDTLDPTGKSWTLASPDTFPPNGPRGAKLNHDLLNNVLQTLGQDPKNIDIVTTGVGAAGQLRMRYALQQELKQDPHAPAALLKGLNLPELVGASNNIADTLGYVINTAYNGDASDQAFQKKQAEALSKAMGIVLAAPTFAVPESAPWTGYLLDQVKDAALDKVGEGPDQDAGGIYNAKASSTSTNLQRAILNDVAASGYLTPQAYQEANTGLTQGAYTAPGKAAFVLGKDGQPTQPLRFNFASPAYVKWASHGQNLQGFLNTNVLVPFRNSFPAIATTPDDGS